MEIKECKSTNIILDEIRLIYKEICEKIKSNYTLELTTERGWASISQKEMINAKLFGIVIDKWTDYIDIVHTEFSNRDLKITIYDKFVYEIVKEEITKYAEENKNSIKTLCFIRDFE